MGEYCAKHNYKLSARLSESEGSSSSSDSRIDFSFIDKGQARLFKYSQRHSLPAALPAHYQARARMCPSCDDEDEVSSRVLVRVRLAHHRVEQMLEKLWHAQSSDSDGACESADSASDADDTGSAAMNCVPVVQKVTQAYMNLGIEGRLADEVALGRVSALVANDASEVKSHNTVIIGNRNIIWGDNNLIVGDNNLSFGDNVRARGGGNILRGRGCTNFDTNGRGRVRGAFSACIRLIGAVARHDVVLSVSAPSVTRYARADDTSELEPIEMKSAQSE